MATTKGEIRKLVTRLVQLPAQDKTMFGVDGQEIRDELGKVLERFAKTDDHATRMVEWILFDRPLEQRKWRPTPGEIKDAAEAVAVERPSEAICMLCGGHGGFVKGQVTWQERRPDGTMRRCREIVDSEQEAIRKGLEKPANSGAMGTSCFVDCKCRKPKESVA